MNPRFKPGDLIVEAIQCSGYKSILPGYILVLAVLEIDDEDDGSSAPRTPSYRDRYSLLVEGKVLESRISYVDRYCMLSKDYVPENQHEEPFQV